MYSEEVKCRVWQNGCSSKGQYVECKTWLLLPPAICSVNLKLGSNCEKNGRKCGLIFNSYKPKECKATRAHSPHQSPSLHISSPACRRLEPRLGRDCNFAKGKTKAYGEKSIFKIYPPWRMNNDILILAFVIMSYDFLMLCLGICSKQFQGIKCLVQENTNWAHLEGPVISLIIPRGWAIMAVQTWNIGGLSNNFFVWQKLFLIKASSQNEVKLYSCSYGLCKTVWQWELEGLWTNISSNWAHVWF